MERGETRKEKIDDVEGWGNGPRVLEKHAKNGKLKSKARSGTQRKSIYIYIYIERERERERERTWRVSLLRSCGSDQELIDRRGGKMTWKDLRWASR
jgi:hypothetical protein